MLFATTALTSATIGCNSNSGTSPVAPGEMPIYEIRRNPIIWQSDSILANYNSADSIATIRLPRLLLDTSAANDILISYELYGWPYCNIISAVTEKGYRVQCPSMFDIWWDGRSEIALSGFEVSAGTAFVEDRQWIRLWSRDNPRAWAKLIRYRPSYQPLLLNKAGREKEWYTGEGRIQMSADSDGVWLGWWADLDLTGCPGYSQDALLDTLVKFNAFGDRIQTVVVRDTPIRDFSVNAGAVWVLTTRPDQRMLRFEDGEIVGDYELRMLGLYQYSSPMFVNDTLWTAETYPAEDGWRTKLRQFDFTTANPSDSARQLDSLIFPEFNEVGPTWDGEAFVYWTYGTHGQMLIRRDRSGRLIESIRPRVYLAGDVCRALGSYWVTHHGPQGAGTRGVFLSRVSF